MQIVILLQCLNYFSLRPEITKYYRRTFGGGRVVRSGLVKSHAHLYNRISKSCELRGGLVNSHAHLYNGISKSCENLS